METILKEKIISKFSELKEYQQKKIVKFLNRFLSINIIDTDFISGKNRVCAKCGSTFFVKNGTYERKNDEKIVQRYMCKNEKCSGTQSANKNTPLHNLNKKTEWVDFVYLMLDSDEPMSCRSISENLDISERTSFRWRHRFLSSLKKSNPMSLGEELELDEVYFPFNVKGTIGKEKYDEYYGPKHPANVESELRKKEKFMQKENYQSIFLCRHNRSGDFDFSTIKIQKKGVVSKADLERVMKDFDFSNKTIITDKESSMLSYIKTLESVNHLTFRSSDMKKGIIENIKVHNNNINNVMSQIKNWLRYFHGVSTKYLDNYLNWFRFRLLFKSSKIEEMVEFSLLDKESYPRFKNLFKTYEAFVAI